VLAVAGHRSSWVFSAAEEKYEAEHVFCRSGGTGVDDFQVRT